MIAELCLPFEKTSSIEHGENNRGHAFLPSRIQSGWTPPGGVRSLSQGGHPVGNARASILTIHPGPQSTRWQQCLRESRWQFEAEVINVRRCETCLNLCAEPRASSGRSYADATNSRLQPTRHRPNLVRPMDTGQQSNGPLPPTSANAQPRTQGKSQFRNRHAQKQERIARASTP
jgi:hypothetical protein